MNKLELLLLEKIREQETEKQKLIDIMFEVSLVIKNNKYLSNADNEQVAKWVAKQLKNCGFETQEVGCSWGKLLNKFKLCGD